MIKFLQIFTTLKNEEKNMFQNKIKRFDGPFEKIRKGLMFTCSAKVECIHLKLDLLVFHPIQKLTLNALTQTRKSSLCVILSMKVLPECY